MENKITTFQLEKTENDTQIILNVEDNKNSNVINLDIKLTKNKSSSKKNIKFILPLRFIKNNFTNSLHYKNLQLNNKVEGKYKNGNGWYPGIITKINKNFTYNILYSDKDKEENVPLENIRILINDYLYYFHKN